MDPATARAPTSALVAVVAVTVAAVVLLLLPDLPGLDPILVANLIALVTAATAAGCAGWRAVRSSGRHRGAWAALSAALVCWSIGEALWTWLQATGRSPFPSVADVAYLGFGPLVCVGLLLFPVGGGRLRRLQALFDGVSTSGAVLLISWETALGAALQDADPGGLSTVVSVAYPVLDVAVTVLAVLTFARAPSGAGRRPLALLALGLIAISFADSTFVYLTATTGYEPGDPVDVCWNVAFGCLALAALLDRPDLHRRDRPTEARQVPAGFLPYVPTFAVLVVVVLLQFNGRVSTLGEDLAEHALIVLLVVRQYLTLRRNAELSSRQRELDHQANHDVLTGLANRKKFRDRLDHALDLHTAALQGAFFLAGQTVRATASVGVVELTEGDSPVTADVLLARVDIAMYTAKRAGKARIRHAVPADR